ncbi:MAG: methyltransferase domain-containing protein [Patescibacteria group bacterium]
MKKTITDKTSEQLHIELQKERIQEMAYYREMAVGAFHIIAYPGVFGPHRDGVWFAGQLEIHKNDEVLDMGTGTGILAFFAAKKARSVLAVDSSKNAIRSCKKNISINRIKNVTTKVSDLFDNITTSQKFDVIIAQLPYRNKQAASEAQRTVWDSSFRTNKRFFSQAARYLKPNGRIYFGHCDAAHPEEIRDIAKKNHLCIQSVASKRFGKLTFFIWKLGRLSES